jgi:hypothetical protein
MSEDQFTREQKLGEIIREIALRRIVYKGQVRNGRMTEHEAAKRIAIMVQIANDYGWHG